MYTYIYTSYIKYLREPICTEEMLLCICSYVLFERSISSPSVEVYETDDTQGAICLSGTNYTHTTGESITFMFSQDFGYNSNKDFIQDNTQNFQIHSPTCRIIYFKLLLLSN